MPKGHFERTEAHRKHIAEALKGKPKSAEHNANNSAAQRGKKRSPEQVEKLRQWMLANSPRRGVALSDETKARLSKAKTGRSSLLVRYGIDAEEYARQITAGNRWCHFRKHFASNVNFVSKNNVCADCKSEHYRIYDLRKKYGITPEWFDEKLAEQGGRCAICGGSPSKGDKHLAVDHNHSKGFGPEAVRGLLCHHCNTALERFESDPDWASRATAYLLRYA